jgi:Zn-dependent protease
MRRKRERTMSSIIGHITVEPPHAPPYVLEDVARVRRVRLWSGLGIDWIATPTAWIAPIWIVAFGLAVSFIASVGSGLGQRTVIGVVYGVLAAANIVVHQLGGALVGRLAGAPMRSVTFTATLAYNEYDESRDYPGRVHLMRGLGEPAANLALGVAMLVLYLVGLDSHFVLFLAILNLAFAVIAMTPLPTMHGGVVLKYLRG